MTASPVDHASLNGAESRDDILPAKNMRHDFQIDEHAVSVAQGYCLRLPSYQYT